MAENYDSYTDEELQVIYDRVQARIKKKIESFESMSGDCSPEEYYQLKSSFAKYRQQELCDISCWLALAYIPLLIISLVIAALCNRTFAIVFLLVSILTPIVAIILKTIADCRYNKEIKGIDHTIIYIMSNMSGD